ncbi:MULTISPECIES: acyltransferase family protein [unclassified Streptomyces]|uniref:acyltransferase family protein n=1 Tax=Streptomyces sp. NPDC055082 TaxID=3365718 RepID=UPI0037D96FA5
MPSLTSLTSLAARLPRPTAAGAGATATPAATGERPDGRDHFFDNAKYLAIVLVAMGHAWEPLPDSGRLVETVYTFVYTFHMPVFIMIAGYFSRGFELRPDRVWKLVTGILVPYAVFDIVFAYFHRAVGDPTVSVFPSLFAPYWLLWFLPALFFWRLSTPLWQAVRAPVAVALGVAALASMSLGIDQGMQVQRMLQFLPFYVLGLRLGPHHFDLVRRTWVRVVSLPVFALALLAAYWAVPRTTTLWFYRQYSAQELGSPAWAGPSATLLLFGFAVLLGACFLAWVPNRRTWMSALGACTLYGYLLHGFVIRTALYRGVYDEPFLSTPLGTVAVTVGGAVVVTLLCTPPVRRVLRHVVEPRMNWARQGRAGSEAPRRV